MTWIDYTTLGVSVGTFLYLIISGIKSFSDKKKDRKILVTLEEKRKMQNELFEHITSMLDLGRKCHKITGVSEKENMKHQLLNHKVFIWINLNKENNYSNDMRNNCNHFIFMCSSSLENSDEQGRQKSLPEIDKSRQHIWILIDKYIEEETRLTNTLI